MGATVFVSEGRLYRMVEAATPAGRTSSVVPVPFDLDAGTATVDGETVEIDAGVLADLRAYVPPLVDPADRPSEDEVAASIALLTEDSVGYRALLTVIVQALGIPDAVIEAAGAAATDRLVALADNPEVRRQMMEARLTKAEQARRP